MASHVFKKPEMQKHNLTRSSLLSGTVLVVPPPSRGRAISIRFDLEDTEAQINLRLLSFCHSEHSTTLNDSDYETEESDVVDSASASENDEDDEFLTEDDDICSNDVPISVGPLQWSSVTHLPGDQCASTSLSFNNIAKIDDELSYFHTFWLCSKWERWRSATNESLKVGKPITMQELELSLKTRLSRH